jgi:hypothetical protein
VNYQRQNRTCGSGAGWSRSGGLADSNRFGIYDWVTRVRPGLSPRFGRGSVAIVAPAWRAVDHLGDIGISPRASPKTHSVCAPSDFVIADDHPKPPFGSVSPSASESRRFRAEARNRVSR